MEHHVFAVWDFMSLLKALQQSLTCVTVPWLPTANNLSRRLINEIVLSEESDTNADGLYKSHFEIYLSAMVQCGADTRAINCFLKLLRSGTPVREALRVGRVPLPAQSFVRSTWEIIETGKPHMIAAAFALGREEVIPDMFRSLAGRMHIRFPKQTTIFSDYLERHIILDGDHHTPMALAMLWELCGEDSRKQEEVENAARASLLARIKLWNAVVKKLRRVSPALITVAHQTPED
jgi:pyrroloquinoline quinone (PQQ) biosynthesis protein C